MIGHTLSKRIRQGESCLLQTVHRRGGIKLEGDVCSVYTVDAFPASAINSHRLSGGGRAFRGAETGGPGGSTSEQEQEDTFTCPSAAELRGILGTLVKVGPVQQTAVTLFSASGSSSIRSV